MREYYVYILHCADDSYYTGVTNDLHRRLEEHVFGLNEGAYTHDRRPVKLVYSLAFQNIWNAIRFEKVVKDWSRKKREALIRGDTEALRLYSKKKFPVRHKRRCQKMIAHRSSLVRNLLCKFLLGLTTNVYS